MINKPSIYSAERSIWDVVFPLDYGRRAEIKHDYLLLSRTMRSVAAQVAIQTHLNENEHPTIAHFVDSQHYDLEDSIQHKLTNFWYKLYAGRAVTQSNTINYFFDAIDYPTADLLRHPVWRLLDQRVSPEESVIQFAKHWNDSLIKKEVRWRSRKTLSLRDLRQSYPLQRIKLYKMRSLDALSALLYVTLMQIRVQQHPRPTTAERYAYALFLYLFGYKFKVQKAIQLARLVNKLLTPIASQTSRLLFEQRFFDDLKMIREMTEVETKNHNDDIYDLEERISHNTLHLSLSKKQYCFS